MTPDMNAWLAQVPWVPLAAAALVLGLWRVASGGTKKKREVLVAKLEAGALVVDVRSKAEYASGHYPGAVNHPVEGLEGSLKKLGAMDRPLVIHCASGARSARAAGILRAAGFTDVTDAGALSNLPR